MNDTTLLTNFNLAHATTSRSAIGGKGLTSDTHQALNKVESKSEQMNDKSHEGKRCLHHVQRAEGRGMCVLYLGMRRSRTTSGRDGLRASSLGLSCELVDRRLLFSPLQRAEGNGISRV